ncbi:NTP transferase domain-containing protein [Acetobacterium malicum]|uniref:NTP transferase domain-containing protein n=1 Tax=Acetobacterium malicum TaxID=52692 RepID=UPI00164B0F39|nr:NTP transferase domain-containing protein [Acetobacterium malicum]
MKKIKEGAIILAAGMSSRMGDFKPVLKIGNLSILERIILTFQDAGITEIVLITGNKARIVEDLVKNMNVTCLHNHDFATTQMLDSVKIGLKYLEQQCERILITPIDIPLFSKETVMKLKASQGVFINPVHGGVKGHPFMIDTRAIPEILSYTGHQGLLGAVERCNYEQIEVEVEDEGILLDADTKDDFETLLDLYYKRKLKPKVRVSVEKEASFFGTGTEQLLNLIRVGESVKSACEQMNLSYSKGWKMINQVEEQLGFAVVYRKRGGMNGGKTILTENGIEFLEKYQKFEKESQKSVNEIFDRYFF